MRHHRSPGRRVRDWAWEYLKEESGGPPGIVARVLIRGFARAFAAHWGIQNEHLWRFLDRKPRWQEQLEEIGRRRNP
jgi:hypothetical protein